MTRTTRFLAASTASLVFFLLLAPAGTSRAKQDHAVTAKRADRSAKVVDEYNLGKKKLAMKGYDPVSYFEEGGGKPRKGDKKIELVHAGVRYRFASEANREKFRKAPQKYEPAYGGWCAYAMASGDKVSVDPEAYRIRDGRLLLFYRKRGLFGTTDTRDPWKKDEAKLQGRADRNWKSIIDRARAKNR